MPGFYTRKGDDGSTGVLGEGRVTKFDLRMEALGALDEANAALGLARLNLLGDTYPPVLLRVQRNLYQVMTETAATPENAAKFQKINQAEVDWLEEQIATLETITPIPREFIIPGDSPASAYLDLARTIVRRAERRMAELFVRGEILNEQLLHYLNRLSSLLFVLELHQISLAGASQPTLAKGNSA